MLAEVAEEAGFPAGVINVVTHAPGVAGAIADEFFDRPEVRVINLIGGVKTARMLAERAGRLLKRTVMELGGFNPMIILDDVDMDYAVRTATFGSVFFGSSPIGILFSVVVVVIAALNLILDFDFIEQGALRGAPKYMEWYAAFGLMVTLIWLYLEIIRLLSKLRDRR